MVVHLSESRWAQDHMRSVHTKTLSQMLLRAYTEVVRSGIRMTAVRLNIYQFSQHDGKRTFRMQEERVLAHGTGHELSEGRGGPF